MSFASDEFTYRTKTTSVSSRPTRTIMFPVSEVAFLAVFCAKLYKQGIDFRVERYDDDTFLVEFVGAQPE